MSKTTDFLMWPTKGFDEQRHTLSRFPWIPFRWMSIKENRHLPHFPCGSLFLEEKLMKAHPDMPRIMVYALMFRQPYAADHIEKTLGISADVFHGMCVQMCNLGFFAPESRADASYRLHKGRIGDVWFPLPTNTDFIVQMLRDAFFTQIMMVYHISAPAPLPSPEARRVYSDYHSIVNYFANGSAMEQKHTTLFTYDGFLSDGQHLIKECS